MSSKTEIVKALKSEGVIKALQLENLTHADQLDILNSIEQSIKESKLREKEKLQSNVKFVVEALQNIKADLETKFNNLDNKLEIKVEKIIKGRDGLPGKDGAPGKQGPEGKQGVAGKDGIAGKDGKDGVGVSKAKVDIDGELVITLTDGKVIEAGKVFSKSVADKIRVFSNSDNRIPDLAGNSGKFLTTDGVNVQWGTPAGSGSMVYPGAGIPNSTGTAWGTSYTTTGSGKVVLDTSPTLVTPILGTPQSGNFSTGTFTWPTFNQNTTGTASNVTGTVAIANGGSGQTTAQAAMNAFAGAVTAGSYLRGNGTNVVMSAIQAADVPILNQNTTGTASNVTGTVAIANGGTGATTFASAQLVTYSGTETLTNKTLTNPTITNYVETAYTANTSTAITINLANGTVQNLTLTGSPTITMPTAVAGKSFIMYLKTGAGSFTVTWSTVKWPAGTAPTITSAASKMDIFSFFSDGTNWYGTTVGQNYTP